MANLVTKPLHVIGQEVTSIMTQTWLHPPITKRPMVTSLVKLAAANIEVTYLHVPSSLAASQSAWPPFCGLERSGVRWSGSPAYM